MIWTIEGDFLRTWPPSAVNSLQDLPSMIGPQRPSQATTGASDSSSEDEYAPALPPLRTVSIASEDQRTKGAAVGAESKQTKKVEASSDDDEDDDCFGPQLPTQTADGFEDSAVSEGVQRFQESERNRQAAVERAQAPQKLEREEWMLMPPTSLSEGVQRAATFDPSKHRARGFAKQSSSIASKVGGTEGGGVNVWTETPDERERRLADEIMGKRKRPSDDSHGPSTIADEAQAAKAARRDAQLRAQVDAHNAVARPQRLIERYTGSQAAREKSRQEDEDGKGWNYERDMSVTASRMDSRQRQAIVKGALGLGGRFGHASTGAFQ